MLFAFRKINEMIEPEITLNQLCTIKFVPVKNKHTLEYVHGLYVVKIIVEKGNHAELYSYMT